MNGTSRLVGLVVVLLLSPLAGSLSAAQRAAEENRTTDEQRLIQEIKQEIVEELLSGEFLRQQIELGIQDYIKTQQESQIAARAEQQRLRNDKVKNVRPVSRERDHIYGNPTAVVSLIEYSDFECPFCKRFHQTPKEIVEAYAGQVNWVYRHLPLRIHNPGAQQQAEASECAHELGGNDAFWEYSDAIYARTESNGEGFPQAQLVPLAAEIGLEAGLFRDCLDSGRFATRVQEDLDEGTQIGITGTPATILLHNRTGEARVKFGAQPTAAFKDEIDAMLK